MFEEAHENLEGLRRLFAGQTSPAEAERVAAHLTGCRECWLLASRVIAGQKASGGIAVPGTLRPLSARPAGVAAAAGRALPGLAIVAAPWKPGPGSSSAIARR